LESALIVLKLIAKREDELSVLKKIAAQIARKGFGNDDSNKNIILSPKLVDA